MKLFHHIYYLPLLLSIQHEVNYEFYIINKLYMGIYIAKCSISIMIE